MTVTFCDLREYLWPQNFYKTFVLLMLRKEAFMPLMEPELFCRVTGDICKSILNERQDKEKQKLFSSEVDLRQCKLLLGIYNKRKFESCIILSRNKLRLVIALLIEHFKLKVYFLGRMLPLDQNLDSVTMGMNNYIQLFETCGH